MDHKHLNQNWGVGYVSSLTLEEFLKEEGERSYPEAEDRKKELTQVWNSVNGVKELEPKNKEKSKSSGKAKGGE